MADGGTDVAVGTVSLRGIRDKEQGTSEAE